MKFKFEINDVVTLVACSKEYQKENSFVIKHRQEKRLEIVIDDIKQDILCNIYSEDGYFWYPENTLMEV